MKVEDRVGEGTRQGCKYADKLWAGLLGITAKEAKLAYKCSHSNGVERLGALSCPFDFLPECIAEVRKVEILREGCVAVALAQPPKTCSLIPVALTENKAGYQCSNCEAYLMGETYFFRYCYRCGGRIE